MEDLPGYDEWKLRSDRDEYPDTTLYAPDEFEWQCPRCGAILTECDDHCPCEFGPSPDEESRP